MDCQLDTRIDRIDEIRDLLQNSNKCDLNFDAVVQTSLARFRDAMRRMVCGVCLSSSDMSIISIGRDGTSSGKTFFTELGAIATREVIMSVT